MPQSQPTCLWRSERPILRQNARKKGSNNQNCHLQTESPADAYGCGGGIIELHSGRVTDTVVVMWSATASRLKVWQHAIGTIVLGLVVWGVVA